MGEVYKAVTGLNIAPDDARFDAGDIVPAGRVEDWMVEQGLVEVVEKSKSRARAKSGGE